MKQLVQHIRLKARFTLLFILKSFKGMTFWWYMQVTISPHGMPENDSVLSIIHCLIHFLAMRIRKEKYIWSHFQQKIYPWLPVQYSTMWWTNGNIYYVALDLTSYSRKSWNRQHVYNWLRVYFNYVAILSTYDSDQAKAME